MCGQKGLTLTDLSGPFQQFCPLSYFITEYLLFCGPSHFPHFLQLNLTVEHRFVPSYYCNESSSHQNNILKDTVCFSLWRSNQPLLYLEVKTWFLVQRCNSLVNILITDSYLTRVSTRIIYQWKPTFDHFRAIFLTVVTFVNSSLLHRIYHVTLTLNLFLIHHVYLSAMLY